MKCEVWYLVVSIPDHCCLSYIGEKRTTQICQKVDDIVEANTFYMFFDSMAIISLKWGPRTRNSLLFMLPKF